MPKKMNSKMSGGRPAAVTQQRRSREADFSSLRSAEELEGPREFLWPGVAYLGGGCKFSWLPVNRCFPGWACACERARAAFFLDACRPFFLSESENKLLRISEEPQGEGLPQSTFF